MLLVFWIVNSTVFAQATDTTGFKGSKNSKVLTAFNKSIIELEKGEVVSNVLKVINNSTEELTFSLQLLYPSDWQRFAKRDLISLSIGDTAFIPIVLAPQNLLNVDADIVVNAFLLDENKQQIGNDFFTLTTRKNVSWQVSVEPSQTFYFKNDEKEKQFSLNILNTGSATQDIFVNYRSAAEDMIIYDTNQRIVKNPNFTFSIPSGHDTSLTHIASITDARVRNEKRISTNGYIPNSSDRFRRYSLYIKSTEPNSLEEGGFQKSNRINFVKLPNRTKMNDFGYSTLPLTVEANIQNILDDATFMSLNLRGFKQLNQNASIAYFTQLNYTNNYYTQSFLQNSPWYIGYFDKRKTVEVGQISSNIVGIIGVGKGIRASYKLSDQHKTSAFYVRSPGFFGNKRSDSYGITHQFQLNNSFRITGEIGRQENELRNNSINSYSLRPTFKLLNKHYISLIGAFTSRREESTLINSSVENGRLIGANYSTYFKERTVKFNLGAKYNDRNFGFGSLRRKVFNHRTSYELNERWDVFISNRYQDVDNFNRFADTLVFSQEILTNNVFFSNNTDRGSIQPGLFYDIQNTRFSSIHYRGASIRYSSFNFNRNYLGSFFIRAGYSRPQLQFEEQERDYFTFQFSSLMRFGVWNFSTRYNYGVFSLSSVQNLQRVGKTPQNLRLSLQNQYQFKNEHLILETSLIYNYNNSFNNHNLGLFPEIFYFTNSGWRFSLRANYSFSTRKFTPSPQADSILLPIFDEPERTYNNDLNIGATVRKQFGIPIPFSKKTSGSIDFIAFYDLNGDGKKDRDEPIIENVIMQVGNKEVITNSNGEASIMHIPSGPHEFNVFALENLEGWFPNVEDSIFIIKNRVHEVPFARGVKVYGDVVLDRQQISVADTTKPFDLSRIKITASSQGSKKLYHTLTNLDGRFEFYLPNGQYEITFDEQILGDRYNLTRNNIPITLSNTQGGVYVSFLVIEKRKKVKRKKF